MPEIKFGAGQTPVTVIDVPSEPAPVPTAGALTPTGEAEQIAAGKAVAVPDGASYETAVVPATPPRPAARRLGDRIPDIDQLILPTVNIVHNVGDLKDTFDPGQMVLQGSTVLYSPVKIDPKTGALVRAASPPVICTVLGMGASRYAERVQGGGKGLLVNSESEVHKFNGTLNYQDHQARQAQGVKLFQELVTLLLLVERPAAVVDPDNLTFPFEVDGKFHCLAVWNIKGTAFTEVAKKFLFVQRLTGAMKNGYHTISVALSTRLNTKLTNPTWVPVIVPNRKNSEAFLHAAAELVAGQ